MTGPVIEPAVVGGDEIDGHSQRFRMDQIDSAIANLLRERAFISGQVQRARVRSGGDRVDQTRERDVIGSYIAALGGRGADVANMVLVYCRGVIGNAASNEREGQALPSDGVAG